MSRAGVDQVMRVAAFRGALRAFLSESDAVARAWDLTPQRYLLLLFIKGAADGSQRMSFTQLSEQLKLSPNAVTELVARAEEAGLVCREPAEHDQRVVYLSLSEEGERRLDGVIRESTANRRELATQFDTLQRTFRASH